MPNDNSILPQDAEAMLKRLFAVAELLAKAKRKRRKTKSNTKMPRKTQV